MYYLFIDDCVYLFTSTGTVVLYCNLAVRSALSQCWLPFYTYNAWGFATVVAIGCRWCVHLWPWCLSSSLDFNQIVSNTLRCRNVYRLILCDNSLHCTTEGFFIHQFLFWQRLGNRTRILDDVWNGAAGSRDRR
jgi:hypothetical protein